MTKPKKQRVTSGDLLRLWPWGTIEHQFRYDRRWRFDWADLELNLAVELDGYQYHTIRSRWLSDMEKMNAAAFDGWTVLHVTPDMVHRGQADALMIEYMARRSELEAAK